MMVAEKGQGGMHNRYSLLSPQPARTKTEETGEEIEGLRYVTFIKSLPTAAVPNKEEGAGQMTPLARQSLTASAPAEVIVKMKSRDPLKEVRKLKKKNEEMHAEKIKEIEDCKFQSKQHDRVLKRVEGDIVQRGKKLKKTMKEFENEIYKKQRKEDDKITVASVAEVKAKQRSAVEDVKSTKDRIQRNTINLQKVKEIDSKLTRTINEKEYRYENLAGAIKLKRIEMTNLLKQFEKKIEQQQQEEFQLKQELARMTLDMNMEAKKKREESTNHDDQTKEIEDKDRTDAIKKETTRKEKMNEIKNEASKSESGNRRLSIEKTYVLDSLKVKEREDGRRLKDIKVKIQENHGLQKKAHLKGEMIERERLGTKSAEKMMAVSANRKIIQDMIVKERKQKNDLSLDLWRQRSFQVNHANKLVGVDDSISHIQKVVSKEEDTEQHLYNEVRKVENDRKKQEQNVEGIRQELLKLQKQNKMLLLETEKQCKQKEGEIKERLRKEEDQLRRALAEREDKIQSLVRCRSFLSEDKHMLDEEMKIRDRLIRIEEKSSK